MALLLDLFGYLSVIVHGLTIVAQSMALGGALFLVALARPFERELVPGGDEQQDLGIVDKCEFGTACIGTGLRPAVYPYGSDYRCCCKYFCGQDQRLPL